MQESQASAITSHIADCETCRAKLAETERYISELRELGRLQRGNATEKRREHRIPAADQASMKMVYPEPGHRLDIKVIDVSRSGLKLCVPRFVAPGAVVQIQLPNLIATAEVRYCVRAGDEFHAGVEIQDVFSSSGD